MNWMTKEKNSFLPEDILISLSVLDRLPISPTKKIVKNIKLI